MPAIHNVLLKAVVKSRQILYMIHYHVSSWRSRDDLRVGLECSVVPNFCCVIMQGFTNYIKLCIDPSLVQIGIESHAITHPFSERLPMRSRSPLQFLMKQREMIEEGIPNRRQRGRNCGQRRRKEKKGGEGGATLLYVNW